MPTRANQNETDKAWAAGFIDGEGFIGTVECTRGLIKSGKRAPKNRNFSAVVNASQTKRAVIDNLHRILGGNVGTTRCKSGVVYSWRAYGDNAIVALRMILPYLVGKARQAELLLEFQATKRRDLSNPGWKRLTQEEHEHRLAIHLELRRLNAPREFLDAERLNEEAPYKPKVKGWKGNKDGAIVRTLTNAQVSEESGNASPASEVIN